MTMTASLWSALSLAALAFAVGSVLVLSPVHAQSVTPLTPLSSQLGIGSTGANVRTLQTFLATSPTAYPAGIISGYYGTLTANAVSQFQIAYGLPPVGHVGPLTLAKINSLIGQGVTRLDIDAPLVSNVQVSSSGGSATITWNTNEVAMGKVHYDSLSLTMFEASQSMIEPQTTGTVVSESVQTTSHSVTLTGLTPGQTYYFSTASTDLSGNISVTLPAPFVAH